MITPAPLPRRSFWQRRLGDPVLALLTQGVTADKIAATLALGAVLSVFPIFGLTTPLNILAGLKFRMNQPLLQLLNYLMTPVHLIMIFVYVRAGEAIWGVHEAQFSLAELFTVFRDQPFGVFLHRFGWTGIHAVTAWLVSAPVIVAGLYYSLRPLLRKFAGLRTATRT